MYYNPLFINVDYKTVQNQREKDLEYLKINEIRCSDIIIGGVIE